MGFAKTFLLSLITFIGVTFGGWVLVLALEGKIGDFLTQLINFPYLGIPELVNALFGPITRYPGYIIGGIDVTTIGDTNVTFGYLDSLLVGTGFQLVPLIEFIFYILAPLLAAIVAGVVGKSKGEIFGGWFLTACVCMGGSLTLILINGVFPSLLLIVILTIVIAGVVNGFFYGALALLIGKLESF